MKFTKFFNEKFPSQCIGFSTFCELRPRNVFYLEGMEHTLYVLYLTLKHQINDEDARF